MPKGLLSVVAGNTPAVRGAVVDDLLGVSPRAAVLSVSVQNRDAGYPVVQRLFFGAGPGLGEEPSMGVTGDPAVILRQDLLAVCRAAERSHVILALPGGLDLLPFLAELWRTPLGSTALADHYDLAPLVVGVEPASLMADLGCVHQAVRLWNGAERGDPLTVAEVAARQVEAADALAVRASGSGDPWQVAGVASLTAHLNTAASFLPSGRTPPVDGALRSLLRPRPQGVGEDWQDRLEPVTAPGARRGADDGVRSVLWRARRPVHPERLADALPEVMRGVVRSRGHLWLPGRPDSVVRWLSAGAHLELRESGSWLEAEDSRAWAAVSPQRRTLASWFWDDYYGERRDEVVFTGLELDRQRIHSVLNTALLTDEELSLGREFWESAPDPLLDGSDPR